jgi:protein-S-isoprenylcysteine O-methyltransferase Ste14
MKPSLRWFRLRAVWILAVPFVVLARPTPSLLMAGAVLAVAGLAIRSWAAGHIRKEKELAVGGPYAHTRNPLYVGSFLIGLGVVIAGGRWSFAVLFALFFVLVYGRTIRGEASLLEERFGDEYRRYARNVRLVVPTLCAWHPVGAAGSRFESGRWRRNREYEAVAGTAVGFAILWAKMLWM